MLRAISALVLIFKGVEDGLPSSVRRLHHPKIVEH